VRYATTENRKPGFIFSGHARFMVARFRRVSTHHIHVTTTRPQANYEEVRLLPRSTIGLRHDFFNANTVILYRLVLWRSNEKSRDGTM
jgi:hypothetical protein